MNKKLFDKWLRALRSRKYSKGRGTLYNCDNNRYCCLGVLGIVDGMKKEELIGKPEYGITCGLSFKSIGELIEINDNLHNAGYTKVIDYLVKHRKEIVKR